MVQFTPQSTMLRFMARCIVLLLGAALLSACIPADGPYGRIRGDIEKGLRKTADDLDDFKDEARDSTDRRIHPGEPPLRMLVIISSHNLRNLHQDTLLLDLHDNLEARGFEVIRESVAALDRYRAEGFATTQPARLIDLANGLPTGSFGVLEVFMNGWDVKREGSFSHEQITGQAYFTLTFRFAAHWRYIHPQDNNYWERRHTIGREVNDRQITWLEDQIAQDLNVPWDVQHDPELRAAYLSEVISDAFDKVAATMPRPAP